MGITIKRSIIIIINIILIDGGCAHTELNSKSYDKQWPMISTAVAEFEGNYDSPKLKLVVEVQRINEVGRPIPIHVIFSNTGKTLLTIFTDSQLPTMVRLTQPDGSLSPLTEYGEGQVGSDRSWFSSAVEGLRPGESREWTFDLCKVFTFSMPGTYKLDVSKEAMYYNDSSRQYGGISVLQLPLRLLAKPE